VALRQSPFNGQEANHPGIDMIKPKALQPGSTLGVLAPASPVQREPFLLGVKELEGLGYHVKYSEQVFERRFYFAGTHAARAHELLEMFRDPEIDAIICARGGYGCHHLLPFLERELIRACPKIFTGYSDITVLLNFLETQCQLVCFHAPMVAFEFSKGVPAYDQSGWLECLTRISSGQTICSSRTECLREGQAEGILTGGCLSLVSALLGTPYELRTENCLLFLEDIDAKPYQVDRMIMQLKLAGRLERVKGIIFGEMLGCLPGEDQGYRLQDILMDLLQEYAFPVLYGLPSGHTSTGMVTLPMGIRARLDSSAGTLEFLEAAVH
jgi:muramoyltetrapeptide carboxypeptidase